ncbi:ExbD/TolR family protein [Azohydromonas aeria]|uniref:ExbD/TolR family protein n=1 Tax=Azohydromonas aeria TaxID=2590212 RepID=UPI0012FA3334|nr:biopolymer transporter ExbD [Azohydromonas aeria]
MAMQFRNDDDGDGLMAEINTTPLIDVMLVLLIMFIVTIPIQTHAVKMDLPVAAPANPPEPPRIVRIGVDAAGTVSWDGEALTREALEARLATAAAQTPQPELHLRSEADAPYAAVAGVLAAAQRQRATRIALVGNERFLP